MSFKTQFLAHRIGTFLLIAVIPFTASAEPWAPPGDLVLRHDVQRLADAGIIQSPVTTWPITWATLDYDVSSASPALVASLSDAESQALARVRQQREAQAAGRVQHTNIVPVYALGQEAGTWFYAMELVKGRSLAEVIAEMRGSVGAAADQSVDRLGGPPSSCGSGGDPSEVTSGSESGGTAGGDRAYFLRVAEMFAGVADALEAALTGAEIGAVETDPALIAEALAPIDDIRADAAYRAHAAGELVRRALRDLAEGAA